MRAKEDAKLEKETEIQRIEEARQYYRAQLLRKYIWNTFEVLIKERDHKNNKADSKCLKWQKKNLFKKLRHAVQIKMFENEKEIGRLTQIAESFEEFNIQTRVMQILKSNVKEQSKDADFYRKRIYEKHLKMRALKMWVKLQHFLREENKIVADQQSKLVKKFRKIKFCRKVLEALSDHA